MRKYICFLVLSLLLFPNIVKGVDCSGDTISKYSKLLGNITYTYQYEIKNGNAIFSIQLLNIPKNFIVRDDYHDKYYTSDGTVMEFSSFSPHDTYHFEVFPDINACSDISSRYIYVTLPGYNKYYNDPVCDGVQNYSFCNRWFYHTLNYQAFVSQVKNYKLQKKKSIPEEKVVKADNISYILQFYERYYMILLPTIIISIVAYIIYHNRKDDSLISVK